MKRLLLIMSIGLLLSGCTNKIKADDFDIGYGNSLYTDYEADQKIIQSLINAYNSIEFIGETSEEMNYETAISVTFIYKDQISDMIIIDDEGVFHTNDLTVNHKMHPDDPFYEIALQIYKDIEAQFD